MPDIMAAMAGIFIDPDAEPLGRSIAFIGAKGGVGASTIAHNCAFGISSLFSTETILADLDLPFGTANIDFDQDPAQGIAEAVFAPERLDEVFLDRLLTKCSEHLSLLAAPSMLDRAYDFDGQAFQPVLDVLQRSAPVSVLDVPHMWSEWTRSVLSAVDEVVICAIPDLANLRNTKNMLDALRKLRPNDKAPHLILNQVGMPKRPEIASCRILRAAGDRADRDHSLRYQPVRQCGQQRPDDRRNGSEVADRRDLFADRPHRDGTGGGQEGEKGRSSRSPQAQVVRVIR